MTDPTPIVAEKAQRLLADHRVFLAALPATDALILGGTGVWHVEAREAGVRCSCPAGGNLDAASCSHKVAALIAWAEAEGSPD